MGRQAMPTRSSARTESATQLQPVLSMVYCGRKARPHKLSVGFGPPIVNAQIKGRCGSCQHTPCTRREQERKDPSAGALQVRLCCLHSGSGASAEGVAAVACEREIRAAVLSSSALSFRGGLLCRTHICSLRDIANVPHQTIKGTTHPRGHPCMPP